MLEENEINEFVQQQIPENTKKKTKNDLKVFSRWLQTSVPGEKREIHDIPPTDLNSLLRSFYITVRKQNGEEYEPDSLAAIQNSLDRYLTQYLYKTSILRGEEFRSSREVLGAKRRALKREGKGRKPNRADHVTNEEEKLLWENRCMGKNNPVALHNAVWWRNNFFGIRGRDEHHKMRWGDVQIQTDTDGRRFIEYMERDTKTRKDPRDERAFPPRIYETPDMPESCPVLLLLEYTHRRPLEMVRPDAPFYLQPNPFYQSANGIWYKCQTMGQHTLGETMKRMATTAGLQGRKTNHSGCKTTIKRLREASVEPVDIIQLTGHKNVQSLNHYSTVTEEKQRQMSNILVKQVPPSTSSTTNKINQPTLSHNQPMPATSTASHNQSMPAISTASHNQPKPASSTASHNQLMPSTSAVSHSESMPSTSAVSHNQPMPSTSAVSHNQPMASTSAVSQSDETNNDFPDDFDVESVMKAIESYEYKEVTACSTTPVTDTSEIVLNSQNSSGLCSTLFNAANIYGGTFNLYINYSDK